MMINLIGGASASSREDDVVLEGFVGGVLPTSDCPLVWDSTDSNCIDDSLRAMLAIKYCSSDNTIILIGKSLGAVRTWWLAYNHWDEIKHFKKIRIILIDPHGWQRGDGRWGSYGRKMLNGKWRNLDGNDQWIDHPDLEITVVYQRKEFPRGAELNRKGCVGSNIQLPPGANHWNCTDIKTDTGQFVAGVIREVIKELQ